MQLAKPDPFSRAFSSASTRTLIFSTALAGVIALVALDFGKDGGSSSNTTPRSAGPAGDSESAFGPHGKDAKPSITPFAFIKRAPIGEPQGAVFDSHNWQPSPVNTSAAVAAPPVAPPMPYTFSGAVVLEEQLQIFLAKGSSIVPVSLGQTLEGGYRVDAIDERQITLTYLPLEQKQVIPISTSLSFAGARPPAAADNAELGVGTASVNSAGAGPVLDKRRRSPSAQLLWHGPQQVKLGRQFTVTLRVTSAQPVRAAPMQIKVDPALLQTVAVTPGRFFGEGDRNFSYRVNPDGSIFVGATSQNPTPAVDAEFVVLTFKPLKTAPAAELSVASLSLHGPAGRVIAFDQLMAFKTTITP